MRYPMLTDALLAMHWAAALPAAAQEAPAVAAPTIGEELRSGFYSRYNVFGFGIYNDLSRAQRDFNVLGIPRHQQQLLLRPDFSLNFRRLELGLKPRLTWMRSETDRELGVQGSYSRSGHAGYINEAYLRFRISDTLTAIAARENLQWGPAALLSASNPFNPNNGKSNPNVEQPGMEYVRLVAVPSGAWTVSLIANTGAGRLGKDDGFTPTVGTGALGVAAALNGLLSNFLDTVTGTEPIANEFHKTYAAKLDYTGDGRYLSVLASHRERGDNRLGVFGGWNASEALLLYAEGSVARRRNSLVEQRRDYRALVGGSYTLAGGQTITFEYFRNHASCKITPIVLCAGTALTQPRLPLLRSRYLLLQYVDTRVWGKANLVARMIRNADDHSSQASVNLEYELGEHWQLYLVPTLSRGSAGSEFGTLPKRSLFFGAAYTF